MRHLTWQPTDDPAISLTGYLHDQSDTFPNLVRRPAVLILPGGGYEFCSDREAEPIALALAGAGYHAFVLRYSVGEASQWPAPLTDAEAALRMIHDNAADWGVDAERIAVIGFSAGGHLAAALSLFGGVRPAASLLIYPVITASTLRVCHQATWDAPDLLAAIGPETPPTFLAHTAPDAVVPVTDSLSYAARLAEVGVPFELHVFPSGIHGLSLATSFTSSGDLGKADAVFAGWRGLAIDWLGRQFPVI